MWVPVNRERSDSAKFTRRVHVNSGGKQTSQRGPRRAHSDERPKRNCEMFGACNALSQQVGRLATSEVGAGERDIHSEQFSTTTDCLCAKHPHWVRFKLGEATATTLIVRRSACDLRTPAKQKIVGSRIERCCTSYYVRLNATKIINFAGIRPNANRFRLRRRAYTTHTHKL